MSDSGQRPSADRAQQAREAAVVDYLYDALDPQERARFELSMEADPALRDEVDALAAVLGLAREALANEGAETAGRARLSAQARSALLQAAEHAVTPAEAQAAASPATVRLSDSSGVSRWPLRTRSRISSWLSSWIRQPWAFPGLVAATAAAVFFAVRPIVTEAPSARLFKPEAQSLPITELRADKTLQGRASGSPAQPSHEGRPFRDQADSQSGTTKAPSGLEANEEAETAAADRSDQSGLASRRLSRSEGHLGGRPVGSRNDKKALAARSRQAKPGRAVARRETLGKPRVKAMRAMEDDLLAAKSGRAGPAGRVRSTGQSSPASSAPPARTTGSARSMASTPQAGSTVRPSAGYAQPPAGWSRGDLAAADEMPPAGPKSVLAERSASRSVDGARLPSAKTPSGRQKVARNADIDAVSAAGAPGILERRALQFQRAEQWTAAHKIYTKLLRAHPKHRNVARWRVQLEKVKRALAARDAQRAEPAAEEESTRSER